MTRENSFARQICLAIFLVFISVAVAAALGNDKPKPADKAAPAKAAPAAHAPSGRANAGRPASGGPSGRPANAGSSGRPGTAGNGRPGNSAATGRPGSNNGSANGRANNTAGTPGRPGPNTAGRTGNGTNAGTGHGPNNGGMGTKDKGGMAAKGNGRGGPPEGARGGDRGRVTSVRHEPVRHEPVRHISDEHGRRVARDDRGRVREIHGRDSHGREMAIHRDLRGGRRFETRRPDGRRVVGYGRGRGFTERRYYARGGRVYYQRTYVYGGRRYAVAYRYYPYRGVYYYGYAPAYYYHPAFYAWSYNPWPGPVVYRWGWYGDPWYGYYGPYFTPYPAYATASLWLTDYLIAENLRAAYEANAAAQANAAAAQANANAAVAQNNAVPAQAGGQVALTPEVKEMIATEVKRQLDAERAAAAQPQAAGGGAQNANAPAEETPAALDPNQRVFIVASNLDLNADSGECSLTAGDVLMRMGTEPDQNNRIAVNVVSSKQGDCPVNTNSDVEVTELQEMHNQFREKLDSGLKNLAENQGKNGLPKAPDTGTTAGEVPAPQADSDADGELQGQQKDAEQAEQDTQKGSPGAGGGTGGK